MRTGQLSQARYVGTQPGAELRWAASKHVTMSFPVVTFITGRFLHENPPDKNLFYWGTVLLYASSRREANFSCPNYRRSTRLNAAATPAAIRKERVEDVIWMRTRPPTWNSSKDWTGVRAGRWETLV